MDSLPTDFDEDHHGPKRTDAGALRILAHWVAEHAGHDPVLNAVVDREFVLVDVPTMSAHKLA